MNHRSLRATLGLAFLALPASSPVHGQGTLAFSDQTAAAGLDATHRCATSEPGLCDMMAGGAAADFDRDGHVDLFVLGGGRSPDRLYMNDGDGTFTDRAAAWGVDDWHVGSGAAVGDFDGDGFPDVYVTSLGDPYAPEPGRNRLYRNEGGAAFTDVAVQAGVHRTSRFQADGFGSAFGDYDLDGDLDLFTTSWQAGHHQALGNRLFRNEGDGTFTDVTGTSIQVPSMTWGFSPCFADMNGDRYPELLLAADFETSRYFVNDRSGGFIDATPSSGTALDHNGMGSAVADFDGDGRLDWYVTSIWSQTYQGGLITDGNKLYMNLGNDRFDERARELGVDDGGWGWGTVAADFNHDGWMDIAEVNGFRPLSFGGGSRLWLGGPGLDFDEVSEEVGFDHGLDAKALLNLDYDGDGDQDLVVFSNESELRLYRNDLAGPSTHWLCLHLDTSGAPDLAPDGFGTRVRATVGGRVLHRYLDGGSNYLATSEPALHLGLGAADRVDRLELEWTDGTLTVLEDVSAGQHLQVRAE